jgi:hypothetical protein
MLKSFCGVMKENYLEPRMRFTRVNVRDRMIERPSSAMWLAPGRGDVRVARRRSCAAASRGSREGRAVGSVAAELGPQLREVREEVGLAPQFVRDHRRVARYRRNHRNADAAPLNCLDKGAERSVAREQNHLVNLTGELHGIDGKLDVHVSLELAAAAGVRELFHRLGDHGVAVVTEPICQRAQRGIFLIFTDCRVVERAQQRPSAFKFFEEALVVDLEAEGPRSCMQVGAIDKKRDMIGSERH